MLAMPSARRLAAASLLLSLTLLAGAPTSARTGVGLQSRATASSLAPPRFADPDRARKLAAAFPEIERLLTEWVERQHVPGAVIGVVIDGELAWVKTAGVRDVSTKAPVTPDTVFRIASMTKSFTAMAILKLRDEGKLSLDDPVAKYVPELASLSYPTKDSPPITIRHLLTHAEGFPEDNPWGDRQLAQPDETMRAWMRAGIPFSNAPGVEFEYSNYGYSILGMIVAKASGKPYADYVRETILEPLGMRSTTFEASEVPRDRIAYGYKWEDGEYERIPELAHGSFGPMGGLWTSAPDLARYVAFLMSAFPARDDAETGPVSRSSAREMQQPWRMTSASAVRRTIDGPLELSAAAYGYGLGVSQNCLFDRVVGHSGGLPGYGSLMLWLPEHGVGLIGMANRTYASPGRLLTDAFAALHRTGALQPREVQPAPVLLEAQRDVSRLIASWDDALANRIAADNLFMDESAERRAAEIRALLARHGSCLDVGPIEPENALRGRWRIRCDRGWLDVSITLAPTMPATVQHLSVQGVLPPDAGTSRAIETVLRLARSWDQTAAEAIAAPGLDLDAVRRQLAAASDWGACTGWEAVGGDGVRESVVKLACERGSLILQLTLDPETHRVRALNLLPGRDRRCAP